MPKSLTAKPSTTSPSTPALLVLLGLAQLLLGTSLGCRTTSDNQIDLLERELRVQEDYIYELEDYVVEYSEKLRGCRSCSPPQTAVYSEQVYEPEIESAPKYKKRSKQSTRRKQLKEKSVLEPVDELEIETPENDLPSPPDVEPAPDVSPEDLEVPETLEFDLGDPVSELDHARPLPQMAVTELDGLRTDDGVLFIPDPVDFNSVEEPREEFADEPLLEDVFADEQVETSSALVERVAERLEVAQLFLGEGDELSPNGLSPKGSTQNLLTVVEALDANGEPVDLDGEISLMVMLADDGSNDENTDNENTEGAEAAPLMRLKRWNFTAEETIAAWQSSDLGDGLHLELPLEKLKLPKSPLELWVRLVTTDGRKLLAQLPFEASQLRDVSDTLPQPLPTGLARTETEPEREVTVSPVNSIRIETARIPSGEATKSSGKETMREQLTRVESQPPTDQPRWRASMQRTDRTAEGFATTSSKSTGWTTQAPGRQPFVPARVASTQLPGRPSPVQPKRAPAKPVWSSGRSVLPR